MRNAFPQTHMVIFCEFWLFQEMFRGASQSVLEAYQENIAEVLRWIPDSLNFRVFSVTKLIPAGTECMHPMSSPAHPTSKDVVHFQK
jgi:hypothetical protein